MAAGASWRHNTAWRMRAAVKRAWPLLECCTQRCRVRPPAGARAAALAGAAAGATALAHTLLTTPARADAAQQEGGGLAAWLHGHRATLGPIRFAPTRANGDGAFSTQDLAISTPLLALPAGLVLTADRACEAAEVGAGLTALRARLLPQASNPATLDALLLAVMLVELRCAPPTADSSWARWVRLLPSPEAVETPTCWAEPTLQQIIGTPVYGVVQARRAWLDGLSESLPPLLSEAGLGAAAAALREDASWLRWADALVWSRAVGLPTEDGEGEAQAERLAMLPGVDMCNHTVDPSKVTARWVSTMRMGPGGGVTLVTAGDDEGVRAGDELLLSYGPKLQEELLQMYGFLPGNSVVRPGFRLLLLLLAPARCACRSSDACRGGRACRRKSTWRCCSCRTTRTRTASRSWSCQRRHSSGSLRTLRTPAGSSSSKVRSRRTPQQTMRVIAAGLSY